MLDRDFERVFSRIEPDDALKGKIISRMEENEMKKTTRISIKGFVLIAACITLAGITTAFAAENIISYFQSNKAVELTDLETLEKYNEEIGVSGSNFGYTLTLDNLAVDDNFLHIFYTLENNTGEFDEASYIPWLDCRINGQLMSGNHWAKEGYLLDSRTYKGAMKLNLAAMDIPDEFKLELYAEKWNITYNNGFEGDYLYRESLDFTEEDKAKLLYVSTTVDKTNIKSESIVKKVNKKFEYTTFEGEKAEAEISKVIFSPFGSQFVVKDTQGGAAAMQISDWALFDENGQSLDILNSGLRYGAVDQETTNNFEFLKGNAGLKRLTLVPLKYNPGEEKQNAIRQPIGSYPLTYKVSDYGSVVVTDIRFADGEINIDYYKDGYVMYDPGFELLDKDGNNAEPGGKLGCTLYTRVHSRTNSYTAQYVYEKYDTNGKRLPIDESVSKENLEKALVTLGVIEDSTFTLDYDNAVEINLK